MIPAKRPQMTRQEVEALLAGKRDGLVAGSLIHRRLDPSRFCVIVGIRGYYLDSMGKPGVNDRGIYDDCIVVISPSVFATFNANCDPSVFRTGIANLLPGAWLYKKGLHGISRGNPYKALVQAQQVIVHRDDKGNDEGWFGINIHKGSRNSTSSLGCQTIHPDQWNAFRHLVYSEMDRCHQDTVAYWLLENS